MKNNIKKILQELINDSISFGLPDEDVKTCKEFLEYNEYGLCFDTIVTQLYEYDLKINDEFYKKVQIAAKEMNINVSEFDYLKDNIL